MKTIAAYFLAFSFLFCFAAPSFAEYDTFTTGDEWTQRMTEKEKLISLVVPILLFQRYGIPLHRTPEEYVETIDEVLLYNPYLGHADVTNIFASTVYEYEPESRPGLDSLALSARLRTGVYKDIPLLVPIQRPSGDADNRS